MKRIFFVLIIALALTTLAKNLFAGGGKAGVDESCGCFLFSPLDFDNAYDLEVKLSQSSMLSTIGKFNTIKCISEANSKSCPDYYQQNNLFFDKFINQADLISKVTFDQDENRERLEFYVDTNASEGKDLVISGYLHSKNDKDPKYIILTRKKDDTTTAALMHVQLHSKVKSLEISGFDFQNLKGEAIAIFAKDLENLIIKDNSFKNAGTEGNNNPAIKIYTRTEDGKVVKNKILNIQFINNNFVSDSIHDKTAMKSPDIQIENLITDNITFKDNKFYRENWGGVYNVKFIDSDVSNIQEAIMIDIENKKAAIEDNKKNAFNNPKSPCKYNLFDTIDTDKDGVGDLCDNDDDNDGFLDGGKVILEEVKDDDGKTICSDMVFKNIGEKDPCTTNPKCKSCKDNCPLIPNPYQEDTDNDGVGNVCEDNDDDKIVNALDNCINTHNPEQKDSDGDGMGDACDSVINTPDDTDGDGILNEDDNCKYIYNPDQKDTDEDYWGDICDPDIDNDTKKNAVDNCPDVYNPKQEDKDNDGVGDACDKISAKADTQPAPAPTFLGRFVGKIQKWTNTGPKITKHAEPNDQGGDNNGSNNGTNPDGSNPPDGPTPSIEDKDNDGVADDSDNCIAIPNADQKDTDSNGVGDACDVDVIFVDPPDGDGTNTGGPSTTGPNGGGNTGTNTGSGADGDGNLPPNGPAPAGSASLHGAGCSLIR